jgi:hypothetical protein
MSKKAIALLVGIAAFCAAFFIAAYVTREGMDWLRREPGVSSDIVNRKWIEQPVGPSGVIFDAPWHLQSKETELPPELARVVQSSQTLTHEADGLNIMTMYLEYVPTISTNLEGAAEGAIANLKTVRGTLSVDASKHETSVLEQRAFQIEAKIERTRGVPLRMRGIVFGTGSELYQIILISRDDQPLSSEAWEKLVKSIRRRAA